MPRHIHTQNKCKMKLEIRHKQNQVEEKYGWERKEAKEVQQEQNGIFRDMQYAIFC